jgi:hypothetical protein
MYVATNPFEPPKSNVAGSGQAPKPGSIWKGVVIGAVVDFGGTFVFSLVLFFVYAMLHSSANTSSEDIQAIAQQYTKELMQATTLWGMSSFAGGSILSLLGGYLCARYARERWKSANSILGVGMGALGLISGGKYYSIGANLSLGILTFAIVYLGGWLREGRHTRL